MAAPLQLTWGQVNAWRLARHGLAPRLGQAQLVGAVSAAGGIQAQLMSAAELAVGARVEELAPRHVQAALWQERTLVKTWAMRATLHLLPAAELPLYVAARQVHEPRNWEYFFSYYGVSPDLLRAYLQAAPQVLSEQPLTREQFADAMRAHTGSGELHALLMDKSWGTPLKPLAWQGTLCFGPSQGQNVTFVNPRRWLGAWQELDPQAALQEVARRYLHAYGPATLRDFSLWWNGGSGLTSIKQMFKALAGELEEVSVEGWASLALRADLEGLRQTAPAAGVVRLLPLFDAYVLGLSRGAELEPLLERAFQRLVFRPQGWISAVLLVDGYMRGVWEYEIRSRRAAVRLRPFAALEPGLRPALEAEAQRLGNFLGLPVDLIVEEK